MAEPIRGRDAYLRSVSTSLTGSRRGRKRLLTEIGDHLEDAIVAGLGMGIHPDEVERRAIERLGPPAIVARAWSLRCSRLRKRQRRVVGLLSAVAAAASLLAVAQHAEGRGDQPRPVRSCLAQQATAVETCAPVRAGRS
jgi:hypothetical protein